MIKVLAVHVDIALLDRAECLGQAPFDELHLLLLVGDLGIVPLGVLVHNTEEVRVYLVMNNVLNLELD